jgi:methanogenic corrinoid protein MtbC1
LIAATRTAGGHRRLLAHSVVEYARQSGLPIVSPRLLGLVARAESAAKKTAISAAVFCDALLRGDETGCRFVAHSCHMSGQQMSVFGDQFVSAAFREIGERWSHGEAQVYQERRACQICLALISELRQLVPEAKRGPIAIGGAWADDPYTLPTELAALVLRQNGWRAQSLGSGLPWDTLTAAIHDLRPKLFWLTASTIVDVDSFVAGYRNFYGAIERETAVVVGGRALTPEVRQQIRYTGFCDNLQHLETLAQGLHHPRASS